MRSISALVLLVLVASPLAAQRAPSGAIEGQITDSVRVAPLAGALVTATHVAAGRESTFVATSDAQGRFRFDSLAVGEYALRFASPMLDSLQYGGPTTQARVTAGGVTRAALAVPSGATIRGMACPGVDFPAGSGALLGLLSDAESGKPLEGASVAVAWSDLQINPAKRALYEDRRTARVKVDASGQYRLCGLPTDDPLLVQVQFNGRAGAVLHMTIPEGSGVLVRDIEYSAMSARALNDSAATNAQTDAPKGSARLAGTVRDGTGQPVVGATIRVIGTAAATRTDERGTFTLSGLPAGSQEVEVRRLGYGIARGPTTLRSEQRARLDVVLDRVATLESFNVVGRRWRYAEFEARRKDAFDGRFLDEAQIRKMNLNSTADYVNALPGFRAVHVRWGEVKFESMSNPGCSPVVLVDDLPVQTIDQLPIPSALGALEVYRGTAGAPPEHKSPCGTIIFWTRR
ncbi:MAG: carboxypeptidase regulatory-like domain-containing protein [Gemmatimonadetes bacterium]|nr:carboxypeptidase regulatory-like domain-containing protein [Gemmatimonadota bacterium]